MNFIKGTNRDQITLFPSSLNEIISIDNEVRFLDVFVSSLDLKELGFEFQKNSFGRPAYHPKVLLKLYVYGYLNRIRSSRKLEQECGRNIELMWLLECLVPDHNTISNFRRDNGKAIKRVFRETVKLARNFDLIGANLIAGDSTKLRAQNSKKNNFNKKKIERHIDYIDSKLKEYNQILANSDNDSEELKYAKEEKQKHELRRSNYEQLNHELDSKQVSQISTSDPDSRHMITRNNITEVAYNIQTTVDADNLLILDYMLTNSNDSKAMGHMLQRAKTILHTNQFTALYDKGYHTGTEFDIANSLGIKVMVAIPSVATQAPDPIYNVGNFYYDKLGDFYVCPEGNKLETNGRYYKAKTYNFKRYLTKHCKTCSSKSNCSKAKPGKCIQRSEYQYLIDKNKENIQSNPNYYRRRQAIVEHPYGTIKRQWGFSYISTKKGKLRASSDVGLMMISYNLRRLINLLGVKQLKNYILSAITYFVGIMYYICHIGRILGYEILCNITIDNKTIKA